MGVMEKIKEIEAEMARTQKNKATNVSGNRVLPWLPLLVFPPLTVCSCFLLLFARTFSIIWEPSRPSWPVYEMISLWSKREVVAVEEPAKALVWRATET
jgi:hypothetical protein